MKPTTTNSSEILRHIAIKATIQGFSIVPARIGETTVSSTIRRSLCWASTRPDLGEPGSSEPKPAEMGKICTRRLYLRQFTLSAPICLKIKDLCILRPCKRRGISLRLLTSHTGQQYPMADAFHEEITKLYEAEKQKREVRWQQASLSPQRGGRSLSLERFRTSTKYADRPAAADIAFCVAAFANGMTDDRIERALEDDYLSRDPSPSTRAAYIRRTMAKARDWAVR